MTGKTKKALEDQIGSLYQASKDLVGDFSLELPEVAEDTRIIYGGSMKPSNAEELLKIDDIDGGLIGGASLKAETFAPIVQFAEDISKQSAHGPKWDGNTLKF